MPVPVTAADPDPLLRAEEVARLLGGVHVRTVHRLAQRGDLGCVRLGSRILLFRASAVQDYLNRVTSHASAMSAR